MGKYDIIKIHEHGEMLEQAAEWFHQKWGIPKIEYIKSMEECLRKESEVPKWYIAMDGEMIIAGIGVIENDFHDRKDLTPNVCAVYVEEAYRNKGIAGELLKFVCDEFVAMGINTLYLVTDHTSFYERYGWRFLCMVQGDGEDEMTRMYIHNALKYDVILVDLDGTLTDPGLGITNSVAHALEKRNIKVSDRTSLYKFIGPPLQDSFEQFYGFSQDECMAAIEDYREYFSDKGIFENELYDGIEDLLQSLKAAGKKVVLATSKPEEFAIKILKYFKIDSYFDFIAGATMDGTRSRKVDVIRYALEQLEITDLSTTVMIGDRKYDILGAVDAGIDSIGVLYGYGNYQELEAAGATYIAEKVTDILPLIE